MLLSHWWEVREASDMLIDHQRSARAGKPHMEWNGVGWKELGRGREESGSGLERVGCMPNPYPLPGPDLTSWNNSDLCQFSRWRGSELMHQVCRGISPGHPEEANGGWTAEAMLMRLHHCAGSYDGLDCPLGFIQSSLPTFLRLKYSVCKKILLHNSQSKEPVNKSSWEMVLQRKGHWTHSVLFSQPCSVFMLSCNFL